MRLWFFSLLSSLMVGFPLGVARRAVDEFTALARTKVRGGAGASVRLAETETTPLAVLRADTTLRAARAFAVDALGNAWTRAQHGDPPTHQQRVAIRAAAPHAMEVAVTAVDSRFALAGGGALYDHSTLQRCWRDIHAASHHVFFSSDHATRTGRADLVQPVRRRRERAEGSSSRTRVRVSASQAV